MPHAAATKPYADYEWYTGEYYGKNLTKSDFLYYAKRASYLVAQVTSGNLDDLDEIPSCVKDAVCAAAETLKKHQDAADNPIQSESNDGYSISYGDAGTEQQAAESAVLAIRQYLAGSGLLFRGVYRRKEPPDE